jgi:hypothetical protein
VPGVVLRGEMLRKRLDRAAQDHGPYLIDRYGDQLRMLDARVVVQRGSHSFLYMRVAEQVASRGPG